MRRAGSIIGGMGAAIAALILSAPAMAQEVGGVGCMAASYDEAQNDVIEELMWDFDPAETGEGSAYAELEMLSRVVTRDCMDLHDWSVEQAAYASVYENHRLLEKFYRDFEVLSDDIFAFVDRSLNGGEMAEVWAVFEKMVDGQFTGTAPEFTQSDIDLVNQFPLAAGADGEAEDYLAEVATHIAFRRMGARKFAELSGQ